MAASYKTLDDIINENSRYDINNVIFYTLTEDKSLIIRDNDLFTIYRRFINPYVGTFNVTVSQREHYKCKPYLLSADVYGTPNLGRLVLMLNDQECASKFYLKSTVQLIPMAYLEEMYDTIVTRSNDRLQENWNKYIPQISTTDT